MAEIQVSISLVIRLPLTPFPQSYLKRSRPSFDRTPGLDFVFVLAVLPVVPKPETKLTNVPDDMLRWGDGRNIAVDELQACPRHTNRMPCMVL